MALSKDPGKIEFIGHGSSGACVFFGDRKVVQSASFILLGVKLDIKGSPYTALEHRCTVAAIRWATLKKICNIRHLNVKDHCRAINSVYVSSLIHGMSAFPFDTSLATKVQQCVQRIGISTVKLRIAEAPTIEIAFRRRLDSFKKLKLDGILRDPLSNIAAQRVSMHPLPSFLQSVVDYRTLQWARALSLQARPARTRGGVILDIGEQYQQKKNDAELSRNYALSSWCVRYGAARLWS